MSSIAKTFTESARSIFSYAFRREVSHFYKRLSSDEVEAKERVLCGKFFGRTAKMGKWLMKRERRKVYETDGRETGGG